MDIDLEKNFEIALNDPIYFWSDFAHSSSGKLFTIASFIEKFAFVISFCIILLLFWMC